MVDIGAAVKRKLLADAGAPADGEVLLVRERGSASWALRVASGHADLSSRGLVVGCWPAGKISAANEGIEPYYYENWKRFQAGVPLSAQV